MVIYVFCVKGNLFSFYNATPQKKGTIYISELWKMDQLHFNCIVNNVQFINQDRDFFCLCGKFKTFGVLTTTGVV